MFEAGSVAPWIPHVSFNPAWAARLDCSSDAAQVSGVKSDLFLQRQQHLIDHRELGTDGLGGLVEIGCCR